MTNNITMNGFTEMTTQEMYIIDGGISLKNGLILAGTFIGAIGETALIAAGLAILLL